MTLGVTEVLCAGAVLLLALYGAACAATHLVCHLVKPSSPTAVIVVPLNGDAEDTELQLRFALKASQQSGLPLWIVRSDAGAVCPETASRLCGEGRIVSAEKIQKMWYNSCTRP